MQEKESVDSKNDQSLGEKLKTLREKHGWSMNELARRANVSPSIVHDLEKGKRNAGRVVFGKLAHAFGLEGTDADLFVSSALAEASTQRTLDPVREWPDGFANWLITSLKSQGIERDQISKWRVKPRDEKDVGPDLVLHLESGKQVIFQLKSTTPEDS